MQLLLWLYRLHFVKDSIMESQRDRFYRERTILNHKKELGKQRQISNIDYQH